MQTTLPDEQLSQKEEHNCPGLHEYCREKKIKHPTVFAKCPFCHKDLDN